MTEEQTPTADAADKTLNGQDIHALVSIIERGAAKGIFAPAEFVSVGVLYTKLSGFIKNV